MLRSLARAVLALPIALSASAQTALVVPGLADGARFGASTETSHAFCNDDVVGIVYVGAPGGTLTSTGALSGEVVVFQEDDGWATGLRVPSPTGETGDLFGYSIDAEYCGRTVIGAPGTTSAYFFPFITSRPGTRVRLDGSSLGTRSDFGAAVAYIGANLTVGAPAAAGGAGRALVFPEVDDNGATLSPTRVYAPSVAADRRFGAALAVGGYRNHILVIGAPGDGVSGGAVYVYGYTTGGHVERHRLAGPPGFGAVVGLSDLRSGLETLLAVPSPTTGEVFIYRVGANGTPVTPEAVIPALQDVPAGRLGADDVAFYHCGDCSGGRGVLVSVAGADASAPARSLTAFTPSGAGYVATAAFEAEGAASGRYGASFAQIDHYFSAGDYSRGFVVGDPDADGTGRAVLWPESALPIAAEETPGAAAALARVTPTPAAHRATLHTAGPASFRVLDALGREVARGDVPAGVREAAIATSNLPAGLYIVEVTSSEGRASARLVVAR